MARGAGVVIRAGEASILRSHLCVHGVTQPGAYIAKPAGETIASSTTRSHGIFGKFDEILRCLLSTSFDSICYTASDSYMY